jgi:hypothetical protein
MGIAVRTKRAGWLVTALAAVLTLSSCASTGSAPPASPSSVAALRSPLAHASPSPRLPGPLAGLLLIADRGNNRLLLVDSHKRILWRYPQPGRRPAFPFRYPDDAFFGPGYRTIISSQEDQNTIQVIAFPSGRLLWHYGHPNVDGAAPGYLDRPDDAYLLANGTRTVADILNSRVLLISPRGKIVRQYGRTGVPGHDPPRLLGSPNGDTPMPDGGLLVTEISGSWIDAISARGRLEWSVHAPVAYPSDAQLLPHDHLLVCDYSTPGQVLIIDRRGRVLWRYRPTSGQGVLNHPSLALPLPGGLIAVNDDYRHRVVLISLGSKRIVWQYGRTDIPGSARGLLNAPDGMDFLPAGAIASDPRLGALLGPRVRP